MVGSPIFLEDKDRCKAILASIPRLPHSGSRERSTIQHCNCLCRSKTRGNRTRPFCRWIHCERSSTDLNQMGLFLKHVRFLEHLFLPFEQHITYPFHNEYLWILHTLVHPVSKIVQKGIVSRFLGDFHYYPSIARICYSLLGKWRTTFPCH